MNELLARNDNLIVHGLWIGGELTALEWLTIYSFINHGHKFHLWVYEPFNQQIPDGLEVKNAASIIPQESVFSYRKEIDCGFKKGSYAGFSDVFRYKLLYEKGGWWADMDITCLKSLDFEAPYFFRPHDQLAVVGNLMKCPPKSELMRYCYERASVEVDSENTNWLKPVQILNDGIEKFELKSFIIHRVTNIDRWEAIRRLRTCGGKLREEWYALHWLNELWRTKGIDKNCVWKSSIFEYLLRRNWVPSSHYTLYKPALRDYIRLLFDFFETWKAKAYNWSRNPGIPVFIKKYFSELE